jgi:hypothetical protein
MLVILQVDLQRLEQEVGIPSDVVGVEGPPTDGNSSKLVTESLPLIIIQEIHKSYILQNCD